MAAYNLNKLINYAVSASYSIFNMFLSSSILALAFLILFYDELAFPFSK